MISAMMKLLDREKTGLLVVDVQDKLMEVMGRKQGIVDNLVGFGFKRAQCDFQVIKGFTEFSLDKKIDAQKLCRLRTNILIVDLFDLFVSKCKGNKGLLPTVGKVVKSADVQVDEGMGTLVPQTEGYILGFVKEVFDVRKSLAHGKGYVGQVNH